MIATDKVTLLASPVLVEVSERVDALLSAKSSMVDASVLIEFSVLIGASVSTKTFVLVSTSVVVNASVVPIVNAKQVHLITRGW